MKIAIPSFETKALLLDYLRKNADKLIAQKKSLPITSDNLEFGYSKMIAEASSGFVAKAKQGAEAPTEVLKELPVEIYANVAGWCDHHMDVMIKDNWNKSIDDIGASGQKIIYHLKNHDYSTDAIIAKNASLFTKIVDMSRFNVKTDVKKAQALMLASVLCRDYDPKTFMLYEDLQIKQHSIGLQYVKLYLCIDSEEPEDTQYKENWDKYYDQVINKDRVDSRGYFWAVTESKILEVSAVLFGANELTPVNSIGNSSKDTLNNPGKSSHSEPLQTEEKADEIDYGRITSKLFSIN